MSHSQDLRGAAGRSKFRVGPAGLGMGAIGFMDFKSNMDAGDNFGVAGAKWAASSIGFAVAPWLTTTAMMAPAAVQGVQAAHQFRRERGEQIADMKRSHRGVGTVGGNYVDTQRAATMRQAAVQAIQGSKLNARSALGGEARIFNSYK